MIKVIANRVTGNEDGQNLFNKLNVVVSKFLQLNMEFLGIIPMDDNVPKSVMQQKPITMAYPNSKSTKAFEKLSEKLLNISPKDYNKKKGLAFAVVEMFRNREKNYNK